MSKNFLIALCLAPTAFLAADNEIMVQLYPPPPPSPHSIVPSFHYVKHQNELVRGWYTGVGVEYRYENDQGYNCKVGYVFNDDTKRDCNYHFHFWNGYKFETPYYNIKAYPTLSLESSTESFYFKPQHHDRGIHVNELSAGIGFEKTWDEKFKVALELNVYRDITRSATMRNSQDSINWSWTLHKQTGYKIALPCQVRLYRKGVLEFSPFYQDSFNRSIYKRGAKIAFLFNI